MFNLSEFIEKEENEFFINEISLMMSEILEVPARKKEMVETDVGVMSKGRLLANLLCNLAFNQFHQPIPPEFIIQKELNAEETNKHFSKVIKRFYDTQDPSALNLSVAESFRLIAYFSTYFTVSSGISTSIKKLFDIEKEVPALRDLLEWEIPSGLQFNEIEDLVNLKAKELFTVLEGAEHTNYSKILRSGSIINRDQFRQAVLNISLKPDIAGQIIPDPINTSYLRGLRGYSDLYTNSIGARKALITNFYAVKKSGYLARKFVLLQAGNYIREDVEDCGTPFGLCFEVVSEEHAQMLIGRYVLLENSHHLVLVTSDNTHDFVNHKVTMRSPARCGCREGICKTCYGQMARTNTKIHAGIYGSTRLSEQLLQRLLSSKHLLKTLSDIIAWPENFLEFFFVDRAVVTPNFNLASVLIDVEDVIEKEGSLSIKRLTFWEKNKAPVVVDLPIEVDILDTFFKTAIFNEEESTYRYDVPNDPNETEELFSFSVQNNELSAALMAIFSLVETEENSDVDEMYAEFVRRVRKSNLSTMSVNIEMIIRALVRSCDDLTAFPDYLNTPEVDGQRQLPVEVILKLPRAVLNSPSITNSLAFERLKQQITDPDTYDKLQESVFDILF